MRTLLAFLLALATALSLVVADPVPHAARGRTPDLGPSQVHRIAGPDRYSTAAALAADTFPDGAGTVVIGTGEGFADALAGGPLAAQLDAPILLVGRDEVPDATASALRQLAPEEVLVLGGPAAVSDRVLDQLAPSSAQPARRLAGTDRFATAAAISAAAFPSGASTAYLATGSAFPDALAGGAAAGGAAGPVLLVTRDAAPQATLDELARLQPDSIVVLGGPSAVAEQVLVDIASASAAPIRRLAGDDRFATAVATSRDAHLDGLDTLYLATGEDFPDALAAAPAVVHDGGALLLTRRDCVPLAVRDEIARLSPQRLVVLGGPSAVEGGAAALDVCGDLPPAPAYAVDASLQPAVAAVEPVEGSGPRPVARLRSDGVDTDLVADELLVRTADAAALDELLATTGGELLRSIPAIGDGVPTHVVRVQPAAGDPAILPDTMQWLFGGSTGEHLVSDPAALGTLALAAAARADGLAVGLNLLAEDHGVLDRTSTESANPPAGVSRDAFDWPYLRPGFPGLSALEGRRLLHLAGLDGTPVPVAVVDRGFAATNPDYPDGVTGDGQIGPGTPWHGTHVGITVAGVLDDGVGSAGAAHPGVDLRFLNRGTTTDQWISALQAAVAGGAQIVNMSFGGDIGGGDALFADIGEHVTATAAAAGVLLFASAGNDGINIDTRDCVIGSDICWEDRWHYPCENDGVICVGGLDLVERDGVDGIPIHHSSSDFGCTDLASTRCSVDIYGPYEVWTGSQPGDDSPDVLRRITGTSFASPYVAAVMAQVLAAQPGVAPQTAAAAFLLGTARTDVANATRVVQGEAAVRAALASGGRDHPPLLQVTGPADGAEVHPGAVPGVELLGEAHDVEDGDHLPITWEVVAHADGTVHAVPPGNPPFLPLLPPGQYTVRATAGDSGGNVVVEERVITAVNQPPSVEITQPADGEEVTHGLATTLRAIAYDVDQPGLPCSSYSWTLLDGASAQPLGSGCAVTVDPPALGTYQVRVVVTDDAGATATDTHTVHVVECGDSGPPCVAITSPAAGDALQPHQPTQLSAQATDPDGDPLTYEWTVSWGAAPVVIGTQPTLSWTPGDDVPHHCGGRDVTLAFTATAPDGASTDAEDVRITFAPC